MKEKKLKVALWVNEASRSLNWNVTNAINNNKRIHISACTGAGKTMYMVDQIEKLWKTHSILVLAPLKAIEDYIFIELQKKGIRAFKFNSDTKKDFKADDLNYPILSTIDSGHLFFDSKFKYPIDTDNLIFFMDETHVLIQEGKEDYDKTVRAIMKTDCPLIGFSATPDGWVTKHLLKMDKLIEITATKRPNKKIIPVIVKYGMAATIAHCIVVDKHKKVVIFTTNIEDQKRIKEEIMSLDPTKKCLVLNRPNKLDAEKVPWDYLMKNGVLPDGVEVLLMNKVGQAGINIKDKDIDAVFMVGKFDPYGFLQYLGRCRNYKKSYYFLFHDYGIQANLFTEADEYDRYIETMKKVIELFKEADKGDVSRIISLFGNRFIETVDGELELNKCMLVNDKYEEFKKLDGTTFIKFLSKFDPTLEISEKYIFDGVDSSINKSKKNKRRKSLSRKIPGQIMKYSDYINPMVDYISIDMKYASALQLILNSKPDKAEAKKNGVLYIPATRVKGMKKLFKDAQEVGMGVPKIIVAARKYIDNGKDKKFVDDVLNESNPKIVKVVKAFLFYNKELNADPLVLSTIDDLEDIIGDAKDKPGWMNWIGSKVNGMPGKDHFTDLIYDCCIKLKVSQKVIDGSRKKLKKLDKVLRSYPEFIKANDLDGIF